MSGEDFPYKYAARIIALRTREERAAELERVPPHFRDMVRTQLNMTYALLRHWQRGIESGRYAHADVPERVKSAFVQWGMFVRWR